MVRITARELRLRLKARKQSPEKRGSDKKKKKQAKKKEKASEASGPSAIFLVVKVKTSVPPRFWDEMISGIDLSMARKYRVRVSKKTIQCWDSASKMALIGVQHELDPIGVGQLLTHYARKIELAQLRRGKITAEMYEEALPQINIQVRKLREVEVTEGEQEKYTFATFDYMCQLAFFIEMSEAGWQRFLPILDIMVKSKLDNEDHLTGSFDCFL